MRLLSGCLGLLMLLVLLPVMAVVMLMSNPWTVILVVGLGVLWTMTRRPRR